SERALCHVVGSNILELNGYLIGAFTLKQFQSSPIELSERKTGKQKGDTEKVVDQIIRSCAVRPELGPMLQAPEGQ
ncbi:hypothetical protein AB9F34_33180, partial [Rhizobium leguminosarum]|uniref:hypothetical protein n=1 Tax=Rhizobium leguminosarum TaxID=384 RepID=UPI003F9BC1C4